MKWSVLLVLLVLLGPHFSGVAASGWTTYHKSDQLLIEHRESENALLQVHATTKVRSSIGAFLHLLEDTNNISAWVTNSERAIVLATPSSNTHLVHIYFDAIWPVSPRDMITQSSWTQDPQSKVLTLHIEDMGQHFSPEPGYVRVEQVQGHWELTPLEGGVLLIDYTGQADPAGKLPHFITDKVTLRSLLSTFSDLQQILSGYQKPYPGVLEY
ncbi:START domain-containing protein [Rheinheimera baltica]|uniref:START domain-containing protein n=1 Tax=Rheinheimera baltica TaxID=67576 RepID=UPI00273F90FC|nr:START domain-containing protein [Rheinheimera baltica]MDP5143636.1 START domain-containing protein [Rheinheimera baltica]